MALNTFRCRQLNHFRLPSKKESPAARMISATSRGGRGIYLALDGSEWESNLGSASSGLAVACRWMGDMQIHASLLEVVMAQQELNCAQVGAGLQQVGGEAVSKSVGVQWFVDPGASSGLAAGVPDHLIADAAISPVPPAARKQPVTRFAG